ncbi:MAG TPA: ParB/RepB/Spo0J family partition protein [Planctomycetaceae bacterium]|jgi:ParB family chromosome partitioning protein|nr:ParB/RepB/Spo0J family partition protein [Planctomycetaceae bacterium]
MDEQAKSMTEGTVSMEGQGFVRRRLGRGLSALLGGNSPADALPADSEGGSPLIPITDRMSAQDANQIHVELIDRNPFQPRKDFDAESLNELVESIRQHGVLQPLLVRPSGTQYQLIAGERRWLAAQQAGLETVPCRVLELEDRAMCEAALEENLKRKDLNVLEKAQAFQDYLKRFSMTADDLARQLSMSRSSLCNFLRLLELSDFAKAALLAERVSYGHARAILSLPHEGQIALCQRIEAESLSVRETESAVRELLKQQQDGGAETIPFTGTSGKPSPAEVSNHVRSLEEQLQQLLGVPVAIKLSAKEKGKIVIPFSNNDDFERILRHLRRAA